MTDKSVIMIHTDSYAGNFEREMCAYVTGTYGECGVGSEIASSFLDSDELPELMVANKLDEHGTARPCGIDTNPNDVERGCQSVVIYLYEPPSIEALHTVKRRAEEFCRLICDKSWEFYKSWNEQEINILSIEVVEYEVAEKRWKVS